MGYPQLAPSVVTGHLHSTRDNPAMRWRNPMPKFDFSKNHPAVKLLALALLMTPTILLALAAVVRAMK